MPTKPWGSLDPNSQHQLWSRWTFIVHPPAGRREAPVPVIRENALRWLRQGFGSVGRARVTLLPRPRPSAPAPVKIEAEIEGVAAHDPGYVAHVRVQFQKFFVERGWGPLATSSTRVEVLAGDLQDGAPRRQLVVIPPIGSGSAEAE